MIDKFNIFQNTNFNTITLQNRLNDKINNIINDNNIFINDIQLNNAINNSYKNNQINTDIIYTFLDQEINKIIIFVKNNTNFITIFEYIENIILKIKNIEQKLVIILDNNISYFIDKLLDTTLLQYIYTNIHKCYNNKHTPPDILYINNLYVLFKYNIKFGKLYDNYLISLTNAIKVSEVSSVIEKLKNTLDFIKYSRMYFPFNNNAYTNIYHDIVFTVLNIYTNIEPIYLVQINHIISKIINTFYIRTFIKNNNIPVNPYRLFFDKYITILNSHDESTLLYTDFENIIIILICIYYVSNFNTYDIQCKLYDSISMYPNYLYKILDSNYKIELVETGEFTTLVDYCYIIFNNMSIDNFNRILNIYYNKFHQQLILSHTINIDFTNDIIKMTHMIQKFNHNKYADSKQIKIFNILKILYFSKNKHTFQNINISHYDYQYYEDIKCNYTIDKNILLKMNTSFSNKLLSYYDYYDKINPNRKLLLLPNYGVVEIKYNNKNINLLPISIFILEMFDNNDNININTIMEQPFFSNYSIEYKIEVINSLIKTDIIHNNNDILSLNTFF
jgi:hypothetical protein